MPITSSAKKALRASRRKRLFNLARKENLAQAIKKFRKAVSAGNKEEATKIFPLAQKAIDKALKRGIFKKNTAARKKSSLAKLLASTK